MNYERLFLSNTISLNYIIMLLHFIVSVWGKNREQEWQVFEIDFESILTRKCSEQVTCVLMQEKDVLKLKRFKLTTTDEELLR